MARVRPWRGTVVTAPLVQAARDVGELVEAYVDQSEQQRRLPAPLVDALAQAGLMRMCAPAVYGGPEADPRTVIEAIEAVATADGAAGWCVMIASTTSSLAAYLDPAWAARIYADPAAITGGVFAPNGVGVEVDGGWRVSGRWQWGSGSQHCRYLTGGTNVTTADGREEMHVMFLDADDVTIHDTWYTAGLCGTGSNDFSVDEAFVPAGRSLRPMAARPTVDVPLAGVPELHPARDRRRGRDPRHRPPRARRADRAGPRQAAAVQRTDAGPVRSGAGRAGDGRGRAARRAGAAARRGRPGVGDGPRRRSGRHPHPRADPPRRRPRRHACAVEAVDAAFKMAGGTAVYAASPLQRCLRDVHVAEQHIMVAPRLYETVGKLLLGGEANTSMF